MKSFTIYIYFLKWISRFLHFKSIVVYVVWSLQVDWNFLNLHMYLKNCELIIDLSFRLLLEGTDPKKLDKLCKGFGFPVGVVTLMVPN